MSLKDELLRATRESPTEFRDALKDPQVAKALGSVGVLPKVLELHAPSAGSRKKDGLGPTLCGINGTRHAVVTCGRCKKLLGV